MHINQYFEKLHNETVNLWHCNKPNTYFVLLFGAVSCTLICFICLIENPNVLTVSISPWYPWSDHAAQSKRWEIQMHGCSRRELRHLLQGSCVGPVGTSSWWVSTALQMVPVLTAAFSMTVHHHPGTDSTPCVYAYTHKTPIIIQLSMNLRNISVIHSSRKSVLVSAKEILLHKWRQNIL